MGFTQVSLPLSFTQVSLPLSFTQVSLPLSFTQVCHKYVGGIYTSISPPFIYTSISPPFIYTSMSVGFTQVSLPLSFTQVFTQVCRWDLHKFTQVSLPLSAYSSQQRERDRRGVFVMFVGHIDRQVGKLLSTQMTSPPPRTDLDNKLISVEI